MACIYKEQRQQGHFASLPLSFRRASALLHRWARITTQRQQFKKNNTYFMVVSSLPGCMGAVCAGAHTGQKPESDPPELELQTSELAEVMWVL